MARVVVTKTTAPGGYAGTSTAVTMENGDTGDGLYITLTGREILVIHNTDASPQTWTATSVANSRGRTEDITAESIAAGAIRIFGPIPLEGWVQTNGQFYFVASDPAVEFGVVVI